MAQFPETYNNDPRTMQRDLTLATNEFCFLQSKTSGVIKTYTGPITMTISAQEALVYFDSNSKQFKETTDFNKAKQLLTSVPENWYAVLKNPAPDNIHPEAGKASVSPELNIGRKINVNGPTSFALFPGQMVKVIRGHRLRTNQYLLARVYDADALKTFNDDETYHSGQLLIIKGTEVPFYIPPTGIEVIPIDNYIRKGHVREAVTLERLEYCILKDEQGTKNYVHGPEVVFPKPTETFVTSPKGGYIFRAIELSKITGLYVKVIAEYKDEDGTVHPVGEELFITGDDTMIYYPRPEHAIINYDNKITHHAIAIPEGEGRYIMNRLTGEITTVKGPAMYLPDPRTEVVVKRKLTERECDLWYPGNFKVKEYNASLTEKSVEKALTKNISDIEAMTMYATASLDSTLANLEAKANISRGTSYTKPRTITLDNKFDGVVSVDVWTGYAVNVISKDGKRKVVCGPQTILLDYDQTFEEFQISTGKPKSTDRVERTVFLRHENNKIADIIDLETKDFVRCSVKVSYCVDFEKSHIDKWFNVENYVKYLCDRIRSDLKRVVKGYNIDEFYQNYSDIVRSVAIEAGAETDGTNKKKGRFFPENGMLVHDCEVLSIDVEDEIAEMLTAHQQEMVQQSLRLADAEKRVAVAEKLAVAEKKEQELRSQQLINKMELQRQEAVRKLEIQAQVNRQTEAEKKAAKEAEKDMQTIIDAIHDAEMARKDKEDAAEIEHKKQLADIEKAKQNAYAETVAKIMASISEDLVAAMTSRSNEDMLAAVAKSIAPYSIASDESVADVVNKMLRGTSLEKLIDDVNINV